jgi:putative oxidoreductase
MEAFLNLLILVARIFISSFFLWAGMTKVMHWKSTVAYMQTKKISSSLVPALMLLQLIGGISLLLGFEARIGALLLIAFVIPAAWKLHDFWNAAEADKVSQKSLFMKDIAILGGLLLILATGAGRFALN